MKTFKLLAVALLVTLPVVRIGANDKATGLTAPNIDSITEADMRKDVYFMASPEMKGRETLRREAEITAAYVRSRLEHVGVKPAGENGSWYQQVGLKYNTWEQQPSISFTRGSETHELKYGEHFVSTGGASQGLVIEAGGIAFAGYAVNDTERAYNDIEGVDLQGKVALILRYEPSPWRQGGRRNPFSRSANLNVKEALCRAAGAVGILMVTGPESLGADDNRRDLPSPEAGEKSPPLALDLPAAQQGEAGVPMFHISLSAADALLGGDGETRRIQQAFDKSEFSERPDMSAMKLTMSASGKTVRGTCPNVAGKIEGELDEWIILGAHHDHLGLGYFGARDVARGGMGKIHPGADDNASGVSTILEIAEAIATSGVKPRRGFLFLTFTGEEKGLLGSRWYVQHPLIPHEKVYAMINIDMIGRINDRKVGLQGTQCSKLIDGHCRDVVKLFPSLDVQLSDRPPPAASDHWPFYSEAGIPVFFPFNGVNPEMHTAEDVPETINYRDMVTCTKMVYEIAWRLSQEKQYADYVGPVKGKRGPNGKMRDPSEPEPADIDEEIEEGFSAED